MPTSKGLSYSMISLPPSAWPTGALIRAASSRTSSRAPAAPAPTMNVTDSASLMARARSSTCDFSGLTTPRAAVTVDFSVGMSAASSDARSPGMTSTDTPFPAIVDWMALWRIFAPCSAELTISQ